MKDLITVRLPDGMKIQVSKYAKVQKRSMSKVVVDAIRRLLNLPR